MTTDDEIITASRDGRVIYWGYLNQAAERFGFDPHVALDQLERDGHFPCTARDPLSDHSERVVYVIKRAEA